MKLDSHLTLSAKINQNGLKVKRSETVKSQKKTGEKLHDTGLNCNFIDMSTKAETGETTSN